MHRARERKFLKRVGPGGERSSLLVVGTNQLMPLPLLYTYRRCPYAMRARMALLVAGIEFDAFEISLRDKPAAMLAYSPKGTVPVLVLANGRVIDESLHIMRWAFEGRDADGCWQRAQTPDNLALVTLNDGAFKQQLDRYKYPERHGEADAAVPRDQAARGLLHALEQRLAAQPWLGDGQPCAADLAIFPFVRQFRAVDVAWFDVQPLPATRLWLQRWLDHERFEACLKKLPAGVRLRF